MELKPKEYLVYTIGNGDQGPQEPYREHSNAGLMGVIVIMLIAAVIGMYAWRDLKDF